MTYFLNDKPVQIIARENRNEVWVETADGRTLRVFKRGLTTGPQAARPVRLLVDNTRGTDGAR